ncbi:hypothetical protein QFZ91_005765 [Paraburkholderia sp. JPY419]
MTCDSGSLGSGGSARIKVDGRVAAELRPSQQVCLYIEPGDHVVTVGSIFRDTAATETVTRPGQPRRYRVRIGFVDYELIPQSPSETH